MCGIAGFAGFNDDRLIRDMLSSIAHRGPDDEGIWTDRFVPVTLGHRRLSIIDLSPLGHQPMTSADGLVTIIFNGEIYNYRELRAALEKQGAIFKSASDTEVLLHLYAFKAHGMLVDLNGIFAFAIWDARRRELFIARDGFGVKPLYYAEAPRGFLFASEMKALLRDRTIDRSINLEAVHQYISYLYSCAPSTMLKNVHKLEPGHALVVKNGKVARKFKYYDLPYDQNLLKATEQDLITMLQGQLRTATCRQLVADVPVGAFLSGGLDSSAVVHFAKEQYAGTLQCFYGRGDADGTVDDMPYARRVADHLGVPLNIVDIHSDIVQDLEMMIYHLDEPEADPAAINILYISEMARQRGIKVILSGTAGDDIFSGYRRHQALFAEKYWAWLPRVVRRAMQAASAFIPVNSSMGRRFEKYFRCASLPPEERLASYFLWIDEALSRTLYTPDAAATLNNRKVIAPFLSAMANLPKGTAPMNKMLYLEAKHFLADHNLNYTDKMGMAKGVEIRVPLLDFELVKFVTAIPPELKQRGMTGKYLFKKAMEKYLPHDVIWRPKTGFHVPLHRWLHMDKAKFFRGILEDSRFVSRGIFDLSSLRLLMERDKRGLVSATYAIFAIVCIEIWFRKFIDE
jgi:asparagine synthase (glutamine-hydrolysing)